MPRDVQSDRKQLVSLTAAAEYLDVYPRTIRRMIAAGDLKAYRIGKSAIRVDLAQIERDVLRPIPTVGFTA